MAETFGDNAPQLKTTSGDLYGGGFESSFGGQNALGNNLGKIAEENYDSGRKNSFGAD